MHNTFAVAEVESLQQFVDIEANIIIGESRIERAEIGVVHVFEDQARGFALAIADHIQQRDHVGTSS